MAGLFWIIVIGSSIFVAIDASTHGVRRGLVKGIADMSPLGWFLACLLLWIIAVPLYIVKRSQLIEAAQLADQAPTFTASAAASPRSPSPPDHVEQLERLNALHASGGLTDEEYADAKRRLLDRM